MSAPTCPQCGASLRNDAGGGLCPACLLKLGWQTQPNSVPSAEAASSQPLSAAAMAETLEHTPGTARFVPRSEQALPEPGQQFGGYRIVRTLGKGGMGAVFEADQLDTGRRVALKVLKHSLDSPEARARFLREGRLAASINHPHSVYVFGTEEIEGTPAIAMELVSGGTLQDFVKRDGPLPIGNAVDVVLQIIAGLEAAQKLGVLHRDIKPANCFVDGDGSVKVGDFGLSISTGPRAEADVTKTGVFLGTPAFSSPEQLRGDELNVRSDMYAVGVTLYYLLTGKTPFEADNLVKLLATVLERAPESPKILRPEIPQGLANVVLRCLQKQPGDRYKDYAALRAALVPFTSEAPTAGTLGLRYVASLVDGLLIFPLILTIWIFVFRETESLDLLHRNGGWWAALSWSIDMSVRVVYFALLEGIWGNSLGKRLCRLKVVGRDRMPPGIALAALRAFIFAGVINAPLVIIYLVGPHGVEWPLKVANVIIWSLMLALFIPARRSNGYSGWHDLWTGTSVISTAAVGARQRIESPDDLGEASASAPRIGPYHVLRPISPGPQPEWTLAYDTRLLRRVWLRQVPLGTPEVDTARRNLSRVGRLRWLTSLRTEAANWDAYEAPSGKPLVELCAQKQSWQGVRYWLLDLAEELKQSAKDGTRPDELALNRVWITAEGQAKLLDFPAPSSAAKPVSEQHAAASDSKKSDVSFLQQVATAALEGQAEIIPDHAPPETPLPLPARKLLTALPRIEHLDGFIVPLHEMVRQPAEVSRERRFVFLLICCLPGLFFTGMIAYGLFTLKDWQAKHPQIAILPHYLTHLWALEFNLPNQPEPARSTNVSQVECLEVIIAYRFGDTIRDPAEWNCAYAHTIQPHMRLRGEQIVEKYPHVTEEEYDAAEAKLKTLTNHVIGAAATQITEAIFRFFVLIAVLLWLGTLCFWSVVCAIVFRRGPLLRLFGIDLVTANGAPASRLRVIGRSLLTWAPVLIAPFALAFLMPAIQTMETYRSGSDLIYPLAFLFLHAYLFLAIWSALRPTRGLADVMAGTWPVPQ